MESAMTQSRTSGLLLLVMGVLTFLGTTNQLLPAVAFFPGLAVCVLGVIVFMKANHTALEASEAATLRRLNPEIKNQTAEAQAKRQSETDGASLNALESRDGRVAAQAVAADQVQDDELVLYEVDQTAAPAADPVDPNVLEAEDENEGGDFVVTTDVSFPLEIQQQSSLADQIAKLRRLADDGIISEDEFAVAKAKLLS